MTNDAGDLTGSRLDRGDGFVIATAGADHRSDPLRLASIAHLGLLDAHRDDVFDRASRLASRLLGAEFALVSIVTDEQQHFIGAEGLQGPHPDLEESRATPLSHSFCQYVVRDQRTLVVADALNHPTGADNLAIEDLGIQAYLGVPIRDGAGQTLGSFCVLERHPRDWTQEDIALLEDLGQSVRTELLLRDHLQRIAQAAETREETLRSVAHDLRASIGGIAGAAGTLAAGRATAPETREALVALVLRQAERAQALLLAVLDRAESVSADARPCELHTRARTAVEVATSALGGADRVDLALAEVTLTTDADTVERIVLNLVRKALQHTDGRVEVQTGTDQELAIVLIRDHGDGLPTWLLDGDLGSASLRGRATGHGIGVFSAVTLARSLGGQITAETSDAGTSFRLLLPLGGQQD